MRTAWNAAAVLLTILEFQAIGRTQQTDLMKRIWAGVQQAQQKYNSVCGTITETRTSKLLAKPMVFHGKFCFDGMTRFALEYTEPDPIRIRFNQDYLNVTTGGGKHTEVLEVGSNVRRTQSFFSKENSLDNLQKNFAIDVREGDRLFEMKLTPRSDRFRSRVNYVVVKLAKENFLLRSLEVDGKSGVNSVFTIEATSFNAAIAPGMFEVIKPQ
jgi:outer membrane lipoprotein-sorting protein